jgi:hypothetical protein
VRAALSSIFHNWFYAGWVVVDNRWASIPPKQVRGQWEPVVSTEEFELGLQILAQRNLKRPHQTRHFYLLQGLIHLQQADGSLVKLTCSTSNANRERGGVPYYCISNSSLNILCHVVDGQIPAQMHRIQVEEVWIPKLREAYVADVESRLGKPNVSERELLEKALKSLDEEELASARLHARGKMSEEVWDSLWKDWQDQRNAIRTTLRTIDESCQMHIATLDDALAVIAKAGILFDRLDVPIMKIGPQTVRQRRD